MMPLIRTVAVQRGAAFEEAPRRLFERQQQAALADAQRQQGQIGRQAVADLFAGHRYHADGIGAKGYERDQRGHPAGGPEQTAARRGHATGLPGKAQLMDCKPDEQVVEPAKYAPAHAEGKQVHEHSGGRQCPEGGETVALPGPVGQRNEQDNENVDHQKPGGQQCELGGDFEERAIGVEQDRGEAEERPDCQHRQDGG